MSRPPVAKVWSSQRPERASGETAVQWLRSPTGRAHALRCASRLSAALTQTLPWNGKRRRVRLVRQVELPGRPWPRHDMPACSRAWSLCDSDGPSRPRFSHRVRGNMVLLTALRETCAATATHFLQQAAAPLPAHTPAERRQCAKVRTVAIVPGACAARPLATAVAWPFHEHASGHGHTTCKDGHWERSCDRCARSGA